ncbi:MAG: MFS transporter, partial [Clostridia bacterium]
LVPMLTPGNAKQAYMFIGIGIAAVFMISQTLAAIFIKETPRTVKEQTEKISVKKMWAVIQKHDQVLWMTLSMLFYNIGSALILGLAYNFYYMEIGYDGNAIFFVLVCGAVNILAQTFYPLLAKHFTRRKIQLVSIITACVGYVGLALMGWTDFFPVTLPLLCLVGAIVFTGQSIFYITSIINMTNCVEYNEYKQGERNEAVVSTLRPFMAKFASALQYGITILVLVVSGIYGLSQNISTLETQKNFFNAMDHGQQKEYIEKVQDYIDELAPYTDTSSKEYLAKVADINKRLESDKLLSGCQIQAEYIKSIGDAKLFNGETSLGRLREIDEDNLPNAVLIFDLTGVDGAANMNFKDIASNDLSMRIWLRMAIAVLPILLLLCALIIQKKKFVINEEYYDKMMVEIDSRHMPTAEVTNTIETAEQTETVEPTVEDNK